MNILLWVIQVVLAVMFLMAGWMKLSQPKAKLMLKLGNWVALVSPVGLKFIGLLEVGAALGLILPMALDISPVLTPVAALGLILVMMSAMVIHLLRRESKSVAYNFLLLLMSAFVAIGRLVILPVN